MDSQHKINHLSLLIENGIDFFERSISQIESEPKYSIINFCAGVELILKARLLYEDWKLLIDGDTDESKFESGDFKTINFIDLIPKIKTIPGEKITKSRKNAFAKLAKHRNKIIHFYHEAHSNNKEAELAQIATEQYIGWFFLYELIKKWGNILESYSSDFLKLNSKIMQYKKYLQVKFDKIKDDITNEKKQDILYCDCIYCKFHAARKENIEEDLYNNKCRICEQNFDSLSISCPDKCGGIIEITPDNIYESQFECLNCDYIIEKDELRELLNCDPITKDNYYFKNNINCPFCGERDVVIKYETLYVCLNCLEYSDTIETCECCEEDQLGGVPEDSYNIGCEFCDGYIALHEND